VVIVGFLLLSVGLSPAVARLQLNGSIVSHVGKYQPAQKLILRVIFARVLE
jgi:hypothetical protein